MLGNDDRLFVRFGSLGVLLFLRLIEHAELIGRNILLFFARLTEASSLHIQQDLIHMLKLFSEVVYFFFLAVILSFEHTDLAL